MTDVWFYHLERRGLDDVLPELLVRTIDRGMRAVVRIGNKDKVEAIDKHLWTFKDDSFLPHGRDGDPNPEDHPIWLTAKADIPNKAQYVFLVEGAEPPVASGLDRIIDLFDGNDMDAVAAARIRFKAAKDAGHSVSYWQQDEGGRWAQKA